MAMQQFQQEPANREACLGICTNLLAHIGTIVGPHPVATQGLCDNSLVTKPQNDLTIADLMTLGVLNECRDKLKGVIIRLRGGEIAGGTDPPTQTGSEGCAPQQGSGPDNTGQDVFAPSTVDGQTFSGRTHVIEDISVGNDSKQILRLPPGELWTAKRVTVGERAVQLIGAFSDMSMIDWLERI